LPLLSPLPAPLALKQRRGKKKKDKRKKKTKKEQNRKRSRQNSVGTLCLSHVVTKSTPYPPFGDFVFKGWGENEKPKMFFEEKKKGFACLRATREQIAGKKTLLIVMPVMPSDNSTHKKFRLSMI
jgi:hypothetical protein